MTAQEMIEILQQYPPDSRVGKLIDDEEGYPVCLDIEAVSLVFQDAGGYTHDEEGNPYLASDSTVPVIAIR